MRVVLVIFAICLFFAVGVNAQGTTAAPTAIAPLGVVSPDRMPTFEWTSIGEGAWYYLWVSSPSGFSVNQWYDGANICQSGICAATPGLVIEAGLYRWWIQAWTPDGGYSAWSSEAQFTVITPIPEPAAPSGTISAAQPAFQWYAAPGASWYYIWLSSDAGHVLDQWFAAGTVCGNGMCSVAPISLPPGNYRWWIQAWQEQGGYGGWSGELAFTIAG